MRIISWNVNGIRAVHKKGLFVPFVKSHKPDIICLQEPKAQKEQSEVDLPEYEEYWNSATRPGYSGTAIFTRKSLGKPVSVLLGLPEKIIKKYKLAGDKYGDPNAEGRVITLEFKDFYVMSVYTPNSKPDLSRLQLRHKQWDPAFLEYCKELEKIKPNKPLIFCGDLNVAHTEDDLENPERNHFTHGFTKEEREGIEKIVDAEFLDTFRIFHKGKGFYTWWSYFSNARARNVGWRIDYIFASKILAKKIKSAGILPEVYGSDHCPITLDISI